MSRMRVLWISEEPRTPPTLEVDWSCIPAWNPEDLRILEAELIFIQLDGRDPIELTRSIQSWRLAHGRRYTWIVGLLSESRIADEHWWQTELDEIWPRAFAEQTLRKRIELYQARQLKHQNQTGYPEEVRLLHDELQRAEISRSFDRDCMVAWTHQSFSLPQTVIHGWNHWTDPPKPNNHLPCAFSVFSNANFQFAMMVQAIGETSTSGIIQQLILSRARRLTEEGELDPGVILDSIDRYWVEFDQASHYQVGGVLLRLQANGTYTWSRAGLPGPILVDREGAFQRLLGHGALFGLMGAGHQSENGTLETGFRLCIGLDRIDHIVEPIQLSRRIPHANTLESPVLLQRLREQVSTDRDSLIYLCERTAD
jgi:hypothetical protein